MEVECHFHRGTQVGDDLYLAMLMKFVAFVEIEARGSVEIPCSTMGAKDLGM